MPGSTQHFVDEKLIQRPVMLWTKRYSAPCEAAKDTLALYRLPPHLYEVCEIDLRADCAEIETYFLQLCLESRREVPRLFVDRRFVGGDRDIIRMHESGELALLLQPITGELITFDQPIAEQEDFGVQAWKAAT